MENENLHSLISLENFKAVFGVDDRDDKLARFCLVTSTLSIEQYCRRNLLSKTIHQVFKEWRDLTLFLNEYPVREIIAVYAIENGELGVGSGEILEPEFYCFIPGCGTNIDIPFYIELSPAVKRLRCNALKVVYKVGYCFEDVPKDLSAACLELASWNMSRYKGRRVGMTGNIRGGGKEGEHFEMSMPENVKILLEPYRRKTI